MIIVLSNALHSFLKLPVVILCKVFVEYLTLHSFCNFNCIVIDEISIDLLQKLIK